MMYLKVFATAFLALQASVPLVGQHWREADLRTPEGYAALLEQYADAYLLPIDERFAFYKTGVQAARHHRDSAWIQQFAYRVASTGNALDSLDTALEYIAIARNAISKDDDFALNIISYQGVLHKQVGDYEQALAYYEEALQLARDKFPDKVIMPLSNIATLYRSQKNYNKTLEYLHELDEITLGLESPHREYHRVYNNAEFCIVHKALNNLDSAAYYAQLCIQNLDQLDKRLNMKTAGFAYITVAEFYIEKLQQPERAKPLLDSAFLYVEGGYIDKVKVSLGKYYLATGALADAATVVRELQKVDINSQTTRLRALELAEEYYTAVGDFKAALASVKIIQETEAKLFNEEKNRLTTFYAAKFKNKQQLEAIRELKHQQQVAELKYRSRSLALILIALLSLGTILWLTLRARQREKFADILQQEIEVTTQGLKIVNDILADKVDKLNAFNYTVSHDLKAPLNSALNFTSLIQVETEQSLNADIRQHLTGLQSALAHMKEMVEGISLYFKADKLELQPKNISTEKEIPRIFNQLRYYYPDHLKRYSLKTQSPLPDCCADPLLFRQAMTNLLSNAVKATLSTPSPQIRIYGRQVEGMVMLTIEDNGIGIPSGNRSRIFQLFKSAHARSHFPGSGVGLSIVQRIVERHGGSIEVHSEGEGTGARFILRLPAEEDY